MADVISVVTLVPDGLSAILDEGIQILLARSWLFCGNVYGSDVHSQVQIVYVYVFRYNLIS